MAFDRIITLSLNPVIDTTLHLDGLNIRAENRVLEEHFEAAGKAVNVARALKRAGVESTAVIAAGRDNWGRYLKAFPGMRSPFGWCSAPATCGRTSAWSSMGWRMSPG